MRRSGGLLGAVAVMGLLVAGCGDGADKAGASTLFELRTGDCFTSEAGTSGRTVEVDDVANLPCADAHDGEVFAVATHPASKEDPYPGDDAVADFAAAECLERFAAYTGSKYDDSDLEVASVRPDEDSWTDKDDRAVACVLYKKGEKLIGSRRKA
jgi:hypothetical protein